MNAKKLTLSKFDFERGLFAEFKYTTSRGAETYGYNICSLYINGDKVSSCMGGGYDMQGTALGDWIEVQFSEELKTLTACHYTDKAKTKREGFYGMVINRKGWDYCTVGIWKEGDKISLDGACGISCMEKILHALGYEMRWLPSKSKNQSQYMILPVSVEVTV